eukprot:9313545-Prorocentrum_lima.AAC.1
MAAKARMGARPSLCIPAASTPIASWLMMRTTIRLDTLPKWLPAGTISCTRTRVAYCWLHQ